MGRTAKPTGRPVIPKALDNDEEHVIVRRDGRAPGSAALIALTEHDMGRVRAGYVCANCLEDLDTAFPDHCPVCKFPMAERQAEKVAKEFKGTIKVGPSTSLEEERLIMQEMRAREAMKSKILVPKPSIIVPRGF